MRVRMLPSVKFEVLLQDDDKTSFALLGLISGCVFQTLFLKDVLKAPDIGFEDFFLCAAKVWWKGRYQVLSGNYLIDQEKVWFK
jgi:hypothetical protein